MVGISWLAERFNLVDAHRLREAEFARQELSKDLASIRQTVHELRDRNEYLATTLESVNRDVNTFEEEALRAEERAALATARGADQDEQIKYLKGQVSYYQSQLERLQTAMASRLGLLPQERQSTSDEKGLEPLRKPREPFAVAAARIEAQRKEAYWRKRADAVKVDGIAGTTTTDSVAQGVESGVEREGTIQE